MRLSIPDRLWFITDGRVVVPRCVILELYILVLFFLLFSGTFSDEMGERDHVMYMSQHRSNRKAFHFCRRIH